MYHTLPSTQLVTYCYLWLQHPHTAYRWALSFASHNCMTMTSDNVQVGEFFTYFDVNTHTLDPIDIISVKVTQQHATLWVTGFLDRNIWHSALSPQRTMTVSSLHPSRHSLCSRNVVPTWQLARNLDVFDQWCLHHRLQIYWRACISTEEVHRRTDHPLLTCIICTTHLKFFDHNAHTDPSTHHSRALIASVAHLTREWTRQSGLLHHTWLHTVKSDLALLTLAWQTPIIKHRIGHHGTRS